MDDRLIGLFLPVADAGIKSARAGAEPPTTSGGHGIRRQRRALPCRPFLPLADEDRLLSVVQRTRAALAQPSSHATPCRCQARASC